MPSEPRRPDAPVAHTHNGGRRRQVLQIAARLRGPGAPVGTHGGGIGGRWLRWERSGGRVESTLLNCAARSSEREEALLEGPGGDGGERRMGHHTRGKARDQDGARMLGDRRRHLGIHRWGVVLVLRSSVARLRERGLVDVGTGIGVRYSFVVGAVVRHIHVLVVLVRGLLDLRVVTAPLRLRLARGLGRGRMNLLVGGLLDNGLMDGVLVDGVLGLDVLGLDVLVLNFLVLVLVLVLDFVVLVLVDGVLVGRRLWSGFLERNDWRFTAKSRPRAFSNNGPQTL